MDKHVYSVIQKIKTRSETGIKKYDTTLEREDLTLVDWLQHAQEEAMDLANYLEVIMSYMTDKTTIDAVVVLRDKIDRNEAITADDRRVFLAALNRILNNYLQQQ
jgi:hypothetical protein